MKEVSPRQYLEEVLTHEEYDSLYELLTSTGSLAPSTHNTQPWQTDHGSGKLYVFPDFSKQVPHADPHNKYLFISVGAFVANVEHLLVAMGAYVKTEYEPQKHSLVVTYNMPDSNTLSPDAIIALKNIVSRQNYRGFFRPSSKVERAELTAALKQQDELRFTDSDNDIEVLADCTAKGVAHAYKSKGFRQEISALINHNKSQKRVGLHGHSLRLGQVKSLVTPHIMKRKDIGKKLGSLNYKSFLAATAVCVFATDKVKDTSSGWIEIGRSMELLMLDLTKNGWACSIFVASLEQKETLVKVKETLDLRSLVPHILFTVGKAPDTLPYSARQYTQEIQR